jgi:hypothetical protein
MDVMQATTVKNAPAVTKARCDAAKEFSDTASPPGFHEAAA